MINPYNFDELIAPVTSFDFFENYWEKKPLILNNRKKGGFSGLLSLKDVNFLLFSLQVSTSEEPRVRFINNKKVLNTQDYLCQHSHLLNKNKVIQGFKQGNTITLIHLDERFVPLRQLSIEFESLFGHPTGTEVFLSPPHTQGFNAHFDRFNAFVLQLEGKKHWKIYDVVEPFPIVSNSNPLDGKQVEPKYEVELLPGDVLYIPRGCVHEVSTSDEYSLHLTLGIEVFTLVNLLEEILKQNPELRQALPIGSLLAENANKIDLSIFDKMKEFLEDKDKIEFAFRNVKSKFAKIKKSPFDSSFESEVKCVDNITMDTLLEKRTGVLYSLIPEEDQVSLHFGEEEIRGPFIIEPALKFILNAQKFSVSSMPNLLNASGNMLLVKSLIKAGFLVVARQDE